jgi:hypothetical protein
VHSAWQFKASPGTARRRLHPQPILSPIKKLGRVPISLFHMEQLLIENSPANLRDIVGSNFWGGPFEECGAFLSIANGGARFLVPTSWATRLRRCLMGVKQFSIQMTPLKTWVTDDPTPVVDLRIHGGQEEFQWQCSTRDCDFHVSTLADEPKPTASVWTMRNGKICRLALVPLVAKTVTKIPTW